MSMRLRCAGRVVIGVAVLVLWSSSALARDYYVSTTGNDTNAGTLAQPFRTIQKAASVMVAGDTVNIRTGIYRETVRPANSGTPGAPITFQPFNDEQVTISGADVILANSWTAANGSVYRAPIAWDLGEGLNQVFLDGVMMVEARWPNTTLDVSHPTASLTGDGSWVDGGSTAPSTGTITGLNLPSRSTDYWTGATIHIAMFRGIGDYHGAGWSWQTGAVVSSATGQLSFTFQKYPDTIENAIRPGSRNPYYLTGKLTELDSDGEWFLDSAASALYFQVPGGGGPASHLVEGKRRQYAFNLAGRAFVTIQGFDLFAASIFSDPESQYLVLDGLNVQYVSHQSLIPNPGFGFVGISNSGIFLDGKNSVLRNSSIAFSSGNGVQVAGTGHRVFNNVIHDTDYAATEASPIAAGYNTLTTGFLIAWNTVYSTAKHGILHTNFNPNTGKGRILHNEIYNYGIQTSDLGCIYSYGSDGNGTEIAYNLCHADNNTNLGTGIYLDFDSSNYVAHHNVVWDVYSSARMNSASRNNKVYNNTFAGGTSGIGLVVTPGHDGATRFSGSELKNNIFTQRLGPAVNNSGATIDHNTLQGTDAQFVNPIGSNFLLKSSSPSIDAGVAIAPYTDGFIGRAPDIGAFESGLPAWKAGAVAGRAAVRPNAPSIPWLSPGAVAVAVVPIAVPTGTTVTVTDGAGVDRAVRVLDVTPNQVMFAIPAEAAPGVALVTVIGGDGGVALGSAPIIDDRR